MVTIYIGITTTTTTTTSVREIDPVEDCWRQYLLVSPPLGPAPLSLMSEQHPKMAAAAQIDTEENSYLSGE